MSATIRLAALLAALLAVACSRQPRSVAAGLPAGDTLVSGAAPAMDARVDPAATNACLVGDSMFARQPGHSRRWLPAIRFDSIWQGPPVRWACSLIVSGTRDSPLLSVDLLMEWFKARGWSDRTLISADGPDGTVQGLHLGVVTCLVEGRWDGGDDSDSTYVPSDTMEVHLTCTRTIAADTVWPS